MTPSLEDITDNLKRLVENISSSEEKYKHDLMKETQELKRQVQLTKEHQGALYQVSNASESQPRASLIQALQDERCKAQTLKTENAELRTTIESYQQSFKLIMDKYKTHDNQLKMLNDHEVQFKLPLDEINQTRYESMQEHVNNTILVVDKATSLDCHKLRQQQETMAKLDTNNSAFRDILLRKKSSKQPNSTHTENLPSSLPIN